MSEDSNSKRDVHAEQLNYRPENVALPKYRYSRLPPLSGSQTVSVPVSSTAEVLFEIPTQVFNLSESYLFANIQYAQQSANNYAWIYLDGCPIIQEIDIMTRSGVFIAQIPYFNYYMNVMRKLHTSKEEYLANDSTSFLFPSNSLTNSPPLITPNNGNGSVNYMENAYVASSASFGKGTGPNSYVDLTMNLPLKAIKQSIFEYNKNLVFPDILVLRVLFGPGNRAFYQGTSGINPQTGATACVSGNSTGPIAPTGFNGALLLYNLTLMLAVEKNEDLAQVTRAIVNSPQGMNILIPFPNCYLNSLAGTNQNISLRWNRAHGRSLLEVVSAPYNSASTNGSNVVYDHFNIANVSTSTNATVPAKVSSYYSQLD